MLLGGKPNSMASSIAEDIIKTVPTLVGKVAKWFFKYPVNINYIEQFETKKGYVFAIEIHTEENRVLRIPKRSFSIKIKVDRKLAHKKKEKLIYGEYADVFESEAILQAYLDSRSYGNVLNYVPCHKHPQRLFLLTHVQGPGSQNPSARFQLGKVYQTVKIKVKKRFFSFTYIEIPIRKITIISGNDRTQIIDAEN
jgi:hypothetical protein